MAVRPTKVPATEAAKNLGRLIGLVRETGAEFIVERDGVPVAQIGPLAESGFRGRDLVALLRSLPAADPAYRRAVRAGQARLNKPAIPKNPWAS